MPFITTVGHKQQKEMLERQFESGHFHHAYILAGPSSVGKTTFALDFVQNVLHCDPIMDVLLFDSEEGLRAEEARTVQKFLSLSGVSGKYRAAIIARAESMTTEAANSLLKVLEEPPRDSIIFLVVENLYSLLPTVISRAEHLQFGPLSPDEMQVLPQLSGIPEEKTKEILQLSSGRPGLAIRAASDEELYETLLKFREYYIILLEGKEKDRLIASEHLGSLETSNIQFFLELGMRWWAEGSDDGKLGSLLRSAHRDLGFNINKKLVLDNLFLK